MKSNSAKILAVVCVLLLIALAVVKHGDSNQHNQDAASILEYSNNLAVAQATIVTNYRSIMDLSNNLASCQSSVITCSNKLAESTAAVAAKEGQITELTGQVNVLNTENHTQAGKISSLTNEVASLTHKLEQTETSLSQTNLDLAQLQKDYLLLNNRLRRDIAGRVVAERRFNNPGELKAQLATLKTNPPAVITADQILIGLDIEVKSNGTYHVLAAD